MSVFMVIIGILMVLGGIACVATPVATTFSLMYFFMILLFVTGITFLIDSIRFRVVPGIVLGILSLIAGGFIVFSPSMSFMTETIMLYIMAGWFVVRGIFGLVNVIRMKKFIGVGLFVLGLIVSILVICAGIYSFINPAVFAGAIGIMASVYFIVEGIDLIVAGCIGGNRMRPA